MTDQVTPEGGALPSDANASPEVKTAEVVEKKGSEADSSPAATDPSDKPKPPESGEQLRIKELTRRLRETERRYERVLRIAEERAQARPDAPQPQRSETPAQPKTLKDFNYDEKAYTEHLYTEARKLAEESAKEAGAKFRAEQEAVQRRAKFDERVAQFKATVEDFDDVVTPSTPVSEAMADAIMDSDEAGALMYYLGNHPDVAAKLYYLSPAKAGREIQKIEDRLIAERKRAAEKPVSQAPPPVPQIDGTKAEVEQDPDQMPIEKWVKWREKQLRKKAKAD